MQDRRLPWIFPLLLSGMFTVNSAAQQGEQNKPSSEIVIPNVHGLFLNAVADAPFSATLLITSRQKLADGSSNTLKCMNRMARDSEGRTYTERRRLVAESFAGEPPLQMGFIYDPGRKMEIRLDPYAMTARQVPLEVKKPALGTVPVADVQGTTPITSVDLGTKTMGDLTIHGTRLTKAGGVSDEYWYAPELSNYVMRKHVDASWEQTFTMTEISRAEPDASRFVVPGGYKVVRQEAQQVVGKPGVYRVGDGVSAPTILHAVEPEYTEKARRAKLKGICVLSFIVGTDGVPYDVQILRGLGMGLDENAVKAVQHYRFKPGMRDSVPVPVEVNIEVKFDIR